MSHLSPQRSLLSYFSPSASARKRQRDPIPPSEVNEEEATSANASLPPVGQPPVKRARKGGSPRKREGHITESEGERKRSADGDDPLKQGSPHKQQEGQLGEGPGVRVWTVPMLAFKPGIQRTKEERAARVRAALVKSGDHATPLGEEEGEEEADAGTVERADGVVDPNAPTASPRGAGRRSGARQVPFRERNQHWLAEANQKDAQGRARDDPAHDPSTLLIPRKVMYTALIGRSVSLQSTPNTVGHVVVAVYVCRTWTA